MALQCAQRRPLLLRKSPICPTPCEPPCRLRFPVPLPARIASPPRRRAACDAPQRLPDALLSNPSRVDVEPPVPCSPRSLPAAPITVRIDSATTPSSKKGNGPALRKHLGIVVSIGGRAMIDLDRVEANVELFSHQSCQRCRDALGPSRRAGTMTVIVLSAAIFT